MKNWVHGIYVGCGQDHRLCALVVIGVTRQGKRQLLAIEEGGESIKSWREVLVHLQAPVLNGPVLAINDGTMGLW